jgi:putative ABC transport system permease protein
MRRWPFRRPRVDADLDRELAAHVELEKQDRMAAGLNAREAHDAARRDLGNVTQLRESVYEMNPLAAAESWLKDLRYAGRSLARNPGFVVVAVLSLALGIGAATAIFTIADQALLRLLPVKDPSRLRLLKWDGQFIGGSTNGWKESFSYPMFREFEAAQPEALSGIAARFQQNVAVDGGSGVHRATVEVVSGEYFPVLGVGAALGRTLLPEDDEERDGEPWAVLGYAYWKKQFGGDRSIVNQTILVNGFPLTVIGVAQAGFAGFETLSPADLFVPFQMNAVVSPTWDQRDRRDSIWLNMFVRLAPGVEPGAAQAALMIPYGGVLRRDLEAHARSADTAKRYLQNKLELTEASQGLGLARQFVATPLHILLAMVGVLLLITCVNVANLLVIRSGKREKEIAVRCSLGASRFDVMRLVLMECLLLSAAGAALGLLVARAGAGVLVRMIPADRLGLVFETSPDWRILTFAASLAVLTALLFGLWPALQSTRAASANALKSEAASVSLGRAQTRLRRTLVVAQVALSLMLLAVAGLFGKSLHKIFDVDAGLAVEHLLSFSINPFEQRYGPQQSRQLALDLQRRLAQAPGVESVSAAGVPVLAGADAQNTIKAEGYEPKEGEDMQAGANQVLPGFFSTLGIGLPAGRDFTERDTLGSPKVVIVNETFVKRFFDSPADALGRRVGAFGDKPPLPFEIVGVVKDHKETDLKEDAWPRTYWPMLQDRTLSHLAFYLRARGEPESLTRGALDAVRAIDPALAVFDVKTVERQVEETHYIERLFARLSATFAVLATLLAAMGLYGVAAFSVARRTREIGVRMALGAQRGSIFQLVLREALALAAVGVLIGAPLALAIGKLIESQLYGVPAMDPAVSIAAAAALFAASALAGLLPARRATRISPVTALRCE